MHAKRSAMLAKLEAKNGKLEKTKIKNCRMSVFYHRWQLQLFSKSRSLLVLSQVSESGDDLLVQFHVQGLPEVLV